MTRLASPGRVSPASGVKKSFALTANDQPPWMELIQVRNEMGCQIDIHNACFYAWLLVAVHVMGMWPVLNIVYM